MDNKIQSVFETEGCGFDPRPPRQPSLGSPSYGSAHDGQSPHVYPVFLSCLT